MKLEMINKKEVDEFLFRSLQRGGATSIKGLAPSGATYEDGEPIIRPINVGWKDNQSGEEVLIQYKS